MVVDYIEMANWLVSHRPLWRQAMWQDLWEKGQDKDITVYHVTGCVPLVTPGNDRQPPVTDVALWLHRRLQRMGAKTMWTVKQQWNFLLKWEDVTDACVKCPVC